MIDLKSGLFSRKTIPAVAALLVSCGSRSDSGATGRSPTDSEVTTPLNTGSGSGRGDTGGGTTDWGAHCGQSGKAGFVAEFWVDVQGVFLARDAAALAELGYATLGPYPDGGSVLKWCALPGPFQIVAYDASETRCGMSASVDLPQGDELDWSVFDLPGTFEPATFECLPP